MSENYLDWNLHHLQQHLQGAVDLEFWTIPFYMATMYSLKDPSTECYQLIKTVVNQEMLHVELAANVANAFGLSPTFDAPQYKGKKIPHLDFNLDTPNPTDLYKPYSAEIGPLDFNRINTMCLVEYPEWLTERQPNRRDDVKQYGSIAEFYKAVEFGAGQRVSDLKGGVNQVNIFGNFYNNFNATISANKEAGLQQALDLIGAITTQGEGQNEGDADIPKKFQNTADNIKASWTHFKKFSYIRDILRKTPKDVWPETYSGEANPRPGTEEHEAQQILINSFNLFRETLTQLFQGSKPENFGRAMSKVGAGILNCWQKGAIPKFSESR